MHLKGLIPSCRAYLHAVLMPHAVTQQTNSRIGSVYAALALHLYRPSTLAHSHMLSLCHILSYQALRVCVCTIFTALACVMLRLR